MTMTIDTPTRCASATVPCPGCPACVEEGQRVSVTVTCGGKNLKMGRVPVFGDEVRVPCRPKKSKKVVIYDGPGPPYLAAPEITDCPKCQGRGWTATEDGWAWWRVVHRTFYLRLAKTTYPHDRFRFRIDNEWGDWDNDPEEAFFTGLEGLLSQLPGVEF